jgi:DNA modification methylase/transcriptional regulator with XRE-family HTH domain
MNTLTLLSQIQEKANLSAAKLAELLGTSLVSVTRWQRGMGEPSPSQTQRLAELYDSLLEGRAPAVCESNPFSSRGARNRVGGQGILGETLPVIKPSDARQAPILTRLMNEGVFLDDGRPTIDRLLQAHRVPGHTMKTPFAGAISAGKNTYTYDAHTYHTKVPPQGISEFLSYYLPQGGLVLDPFSGSGMTGVAASVTGNDCILNELSPAACFISNRFTTAISPSAFEAAVAAVMAELSSLRMKLYSTECRECGKSAELLYTVWSYRVICNDCGHEFLLWDHCKKFGKVVKEHKILSEFPCPSCQKIQRKSLLKRTLAVPVLVGYKCCGSKQQEATHTPSSKDLQRIETLESSAPLAEGFYPNKKLPDGVNLRQPAKHGLDRIEKFYTRRNLSALSHIWKAIHHIESPQLAGHLAFVFTSLYQRVSRLSEFRFWGGSGNMARFNVPFIFNEANVFVGFERKARTILDHLETTAHEFKGQVAVVNGSATSMDKIPDDSVDLIFTDPPFGANINYSEMNLLWESWLGLYTDSKNEAIVNRVQGKGVAEYEGLMTQSLTESFRVLRPGHWMLLVFMNSSSEVWVALKNAISSAGFQVMKMDLFDKQHGTFKQFVSENTAGMDLVLHCLKPVTGAFDSQNRPTEVGIDVIGFLRSRRHGLPTSTFLHVGREEELDYRTLYSEWLAQAFGHEREFVGFAAFREIVDRWLNEDN